jgi:CHASE3 domain sensor protein
LNSTFGRQSLVKLIIPLPPIINAKLVELNRAIVFVQAGDQAAAVDAIRTDRGKNLMDDIRAILINVNDELDVITVEAQSDADDSFDYLEVSVYGSLGVIAAVILVGCLAFLLSDSRAQQRTNDELRGLLAAARSATKVKSMFLASMSHGILYHTIT